MNIVINKRLQIPSEFVEGKSKDEFKKFVLPMLYREDFEDVWNKVKDYAKKEEPNQSYQDKLSDKLEKKVKRG